MLPSDDDIEVARFVQINLATTQIKQDSSARTDTLTSRVNSVRPAGINSRVVLMPSKQFWLIIPYAKFSSSGIVSTSKYLLAQKDYRGGEEMSTKRERVTSGAF